MVTLCTKYGLTGEIMKKIYYYRDEQNDDFAATKIKTVKIPDDYKYINRNIFYRIGERFIRVLAFPLIFIILKIVYLIRYKNRKVLKKAKKQGFFVFGNHTNYLLDAYNPSVISFPKRAYIIVNPDAVSIKGIRTIVKMLGAVPIPATLKGMKRFQGSIAELIARKRVIAIYPEAHIWPYYTDIRYFGTQSFHYAVECKAPCFTYTNIYTQRKLKFLKCPKVVTYIDGPFYPDETLSKKAAVEKLRNEIYGAMKKRVDENPKYNYCDYIFVDNIDDNQSPQPSENKT